MNKYRNIKTVVEVDLTWKPYGIETPEREYRFHPVRMWRFDFAWVALKIAVEIEGGIWTGGAHVRGKHFMSDCEKYNTAAMMGWKVLRFVPKQLRKGEAQSFLMNFMVGRTV